MDTKENGNYSSLKGLPFIKLKGKMGRVLNAEDFGVLTETELQATLELKLEIVFRNYLNLTACNAKLAKKALEAELALG